MKIVGIFDTINEEGYPEKCANVLLSKSDVEDLEHAIGHLRPHVDEGGEYDQRLVDLTEKLILLEHIFR